MRKAAGGRPCSYQAAVPFCIVKIRRAIVAEMPVLEAVQRRSSNIWEAYREQLAAHPDAIELPEAFIERGWVRVAVADDDTVIGFSVVIQAMARRMNLTASSSNQPISNAVWGGR